MSYFRLGALAVACAAAYWGGCSPSSEKSPDGKSDEPSLKPNCPPTLRKRGEPIDLSSICSGDGSYVSDFVSVDKGIIGICNPPFAPVDGQPASAGRLFEKFNGKDLFAYPTFNAVPNSLLVTDDKIFVTVYRNSNNGEMSRGAGILIYDRHNKNTPPVFKAFPSPSVETFASYGLTNTSRGDTLKDLFQDGVINKLNIPGQIVLQGDLVIVPMTGANDFGDPKRARKPSFLPSGFHVFSIKENQFIQFCPVSTFDSHTASVSSNGKVNILGGGAIGSDGSIFTESASQDFNPLFCMPFLTTNLGPNGAGFGLSNALGLVSYFPTTAGTLLKLDRGLTTPIDLSGEMKEMAQKSLVNNVTWLGGYLVATGYNKKAIFVLDPESPGNLAKKFVTGGGSIGKIAVTNENGKFKVNVAEGNVISVYEVEQLNCQ